MDFNNRVAAVVELFGQQFWITESLINTWFIGGALILLAIIVNVKSKKFTDVPTSKFQNIFEALVEMFYNFTVDTMGPQYTSYGFWFFGVIAFIMFSNLAGLVGIRPPTADIAVTLTLSLSTCFLIHYSGITKSKSQYWKDYVSPMPFFLPLNLIGEIATPVSLAFRLFGNILSGTIIMALIYSMLPKVLTYGPPAVLHLYFDVFAGLLQSYIFVILSMSFIRQKLPD
ncbi:MAG: F0F1 ATP synthase subunit A [Lachnospirales bacterium]